MRGRVVYIPSAQRACCVARSPPFVIKAQSRGSKPRFGSSHLVRGFLCSPVKDQRVVAERLVVVRMISIIHQLRVFRDRHPPRIPKQRG